MIAHGCREAAGTESGLQGNGTFFPSDDFEGIHKKRRPREGPPLS